MLNPNLFALLEKRFGSGNVKIAHENQEMDCAYTLDPTQSVDNIRYSIQIDSPGEEYLVRCPFCQDWKHRLYINHRWGVYDPKTNSRNLWLANCWNEPCLKDYVKQRSLYDQVVEFNQIGPRQQPTVVKRKDANVTVSRPKRLELPGAMWPLDHMAGRSPRHEAITYVQSRLWDPVYLGKRFNVGYCIDSYYALAKNRIVAPITMNGELVGWQARFIGDIKDKNVPKWYTCPGMHVGRCLYNFDVMKLHSTKVIVEGPADVWSFGPQAAGIFNKNMTAEQRKILADVCQSNDVVVILLDPEQDEKSKARGEQHHIEKLYSELQREPKLAGRIVKVYLPHGCDPDELDREYMHGLIRHVASKQNLTVNFGKPVKHEPVRNISA